MTEPGKKKADEELEAAIRAELESTRNFVHGITEKLRSAEIPGGPLPAGEGVDSLRAELSVCRTELGHLRFRYESRGEELRKVKALHAELERMTMMRPESMRRAGETEITELVRRKQELGERERAFEKERAAWAAERERAAAASGEELSSLREKLEQEHASRVAALNALEENLSEREKAASAQSSRLRTDIERARSLAVEETAANFGREIAALESTFRKERAILQSESDKWRLKAEELLAQISSARDMAEERSREAEALAAALKETRALARQAEKERDAALRRSADSEKRAAEAEKLRAELWAAEEEVKRLQVSAGEERKVLALKVSSLELALEESGRAAALQQNKMEAVVPDLEARLKTEAVRCETLKTELVSVRGHLESALKESARLEEALTLEKERHLKQEAERDAERTRKMEALIAETEKKERELEDVWTRRHKALEAEQKEFHSEFEKRHLQLLEDLKASSAGVDKFYAQKEARLLELNRTITAEFQDRESKARALEEEVRARVSGLAEASAELQADFEQKSKELETIKVRLLSGLPGGRGKDDGA